MKLEELYDRYGEKMFNYLTIKLGSTSDAEDVLQEVFLRFVRYSIRWKLIRNVEAFIFRIVRNEANRFLRNKKKQDINPQGDGGLAEIISSAIEGPDQIATDTLSYALARLPEEQREVIVLRIFEGLTFKEIASACGLSVNTAASRYRYALARLKSLVEEKDERA